MDIKPTICAIATPQGIGAQGTIKISGAEAIAIATQIFTPAKKEVKISELPPYTACYGYIREHKKGEVIDDVMLLVMRAPHSYTGEDQVEITCHGSPLILKWAMQELLQAGATLATAGEFTRRALSNGKMDLSQAEGVADLIASSNRAALRLARSQMKGLFSKQINALREQLIEIASLIELELDFSEEDVEFVDRSTLHTKINQVEQTILHLAKSYHDSQVIKKGIPIAIVGPTNAGKSTLLNALLEEERAIVSDMHGTTRDFIEETLFIHGQEFRLIDTAGIRHTIDEIEQIGIERALQRAQEATLVLWLIDPTATEEDPRTLYQSIGIKEEEQVLPIINKRDIAHPQRIKALQQKLQSMGFTDHLTLSAADPKDVEQLKEWLHHHFAYLDVADNEVMVTNLRQAQALEEAAQHLQSLLRHSSNNDPYFTSDLMAQELRAAIRALSTVTGEITTDDLLSSIFANFCIGK